MTATKPTTRSQTLARVLLPLLLACAPVVHGQTPSQMPLLTKAGAAVSPNVMLTLDDSGSMAFRHMPENVFAGGTFATPNPVGTHTVFWDKSDNYQNGVLPFGGAAGKAVPGNIASTNYRLRALRSADTNTIFYNPEIFYQPWLTADGVTRLPNSPVTAAYIDPLVRTGAAGTVIDLTAVSPIGTYSAGSFLVGKTYTILSVGSTNFTSIGAASNTIGIRFKATGVGSGSGTAGGSLSNWCFANNNNTDCAVATANFIHDAGVYFRLTKTGGVYNSVTVAANYTGYSINGAASFPKVAARTDCSGAVGPTGCTQAQEQQNYANWFTYYRNRNLLARGGLMEAFAVEAAPVGAGTFVIGSTYAITSVGTTSFTSIGAAANTVDTVFTATGVGAGTGTARAIAMRLGFGRINKDSGTVDGVSTKVIESNTATYGGGGVRDFNRARKDKLFKWLEDLPADGGTPLPPALNAVGQYYSRTDVRGPWTDNPAVNTNVVANNKTCRRSYAFLTTDGYWTTAGTAGNADNTAGATITGVGASYTYAPARPYMDDWSDTLADTAMKYWKTDLQPATVNAVPTVANNTSFWQNMTTYTVGLGVRGTLDPDTDLPALTAGTKTWPQASPTGTAANVDDLWHAAVNSRGQYFSVKDPQELAIAIRTALAGATGGSGATAGVATASTVLSSNNRKYVPTFASGSWEGDITAYPLDANGQTTAAQWTASSRMPVWSSRNIVTFDSTSTTWAGIAFSNWSSIPAAGQAAIGTLVTTPTYTGQQFIDFLRGDHSQEGTGLPFRARLNASGQPYILGDIVNANPVLIESNFDGAYTDPAFGGATAYTTFKAAKAARTPVLFAGSNDGMLHAFKDTKGVTPAADGQEIFAYVPRAVYGNLTKLADKNYGTTSLLPHQYFVDGPMAEADAYVKAPSATGPSWRNYLFGSLGAGGRAVFALDVTDSASLNASSVRWELSSAEDDDIGYVLTPIRVGVLPNGRWVAVFGNGIASTNGKAVLFVVDIEKAADSDAAVRASGIQKLVLDSTGSNGLGGVTLIHDLTTGRTKTIYVGDLKGNLWKLVYNTTTNLFEAEGNAAFFTATDGSVTPVAQPITSSPAVFKNGALGGYMVLFGTGKLFSTTDATDTSTQTVYGVWDKQGGPAGVADTVPHPMSRSNLVGRTLTSFAGTGLAAGTTFYSASGAAVDYSSTQRGWYIDLSPATTGGRVIYPTQVVGYQTALMSSVAPVQGTPLACESGTGTALNLVVPVDTGSNPTSHTFDTNGDGLANGSDTGGMGYATKADGVDAVVSSAGTAGGDRLVDVGGGGPVGDCTGDACGAKGKKCMASPLCPEPNTCLSSIQSATMGLPVCIPVGSGGTRVWRRIINPPIR